MNGLQMVELKQKHLATGRLTAVIRVNDFGSPVSVDAGDYVLVIASEKPTVALDIKTARAWVDAGASYICAWGPDSEEVEESFDYASFLPEYGKELELTTTAAPRRQVSVESKFLHLIERRRPRNLGLFTAARDIPHLPAGSLLRRLSAPDLIP
jgi:hypothetical protein